MITFKDDFIDEALMDSIRQAASAQVIMQKIIPQSKQNEIENEEFQNTALDTIYALKMEFDDGNPSNVQDALAALNEHLTYSKKQYFDNDNFIDKIVKSKILIVLLDIAFKYIENDDQSKMMKKFASEFVDDNLEEEVPDENDELYEYNSILALTSLHFLSAYSQKLSLLIGSLSFWEKLLKYLFSFDAQSIFISLSIGINILIDSTYENMIYYSKIGVMQFLVDIASLQKFPKEIVERIKESTQTLACYGLFLFNYRIRVFDIAYIQNYLRSISLLVLDVPLPAQIHLLMSINMILKKNTFDPEFLFINFDEKPFIETLIDYAAHENESMRNQSLSIIRYAVNSEFVTKENKEEIFNRIPWDKCNDLVMDEQNTSGFLDVLYAYTMMGEEVAEQLFEFRVYQTYIDNFDKLPYNDRKKVIVNIMIIIENASLQFLRKFLPFNILECLCDFLESEDTFAGNVLGCIDVYTSKLNPSNHVELIKQFEEGDIINTLMNFMPNETLTVILMRLGYDEVLENQ